MPGEEGSKSNKVGTSAVDLLGLIIGRDVGKQISTVTAHAY